MKLKMRQRFFSLFDSFDVTNENNETIFIIKGRFSIGHLLEIYDKNNEKVGYIRQELFHFLPTINFYIRENYVGTLKREFTIFVPKFRLDYLNWRCEGDFFRFNYQVYSDEKLIMKVEREFLTLTDTYYLDIVDNENALICLMIALGFDIERESSNCNHN